MLIIASTTIVQTVVQAFCISHMPMQWDMAIFDPPTAPRPLYRFS